MQTIDFDKMVAKIQIWDTAGQERFEAIAHQFYRRAQSILLIYDLCSRSSFDNLAKWISYVDEFASEDIELLLVANKSDLSQWRQVSCEEGKKFADRYNMKFFETSAKNRENIDQVFREICGCIISTQTLKRTKQYKNQNSHFVHNRKSKTLSLSSASEHSEESHWKCCARVV